MDDPNTLQCAPSNGIDYYVTRGTYAGQPMTSGLVLLAQWSVRQKLSAQFSSSPSICTLFTPSTVSLNKSCHK